MIEGCSEEWKSVGDGCAEMEEDIGLLYGTPGEFQGWEKEVLSLNNLAP